MVEPPGGNSPTSPRRPPRWPAGLALVVPGVWAVLRGRRYTVRVLASTEDLPADEQVVLGRPSARLPRLGADRSHVSDEIWQTEALAAAAAAARPAGAVRQSHDPVRRRMDAAPGDAGRQIPADRLPAPYAARPAARSAAGLPVSGGTSPGRPHDRTSVAGRDGRDPGRQILARPDGMVASRLRQPSPRFSTTLSATPPRMQALPRARREPTD